MATVNVGWYNLNFPILPGSVVKQLR